MLSEHIECHLRPSDATCGHLEGLQTLIKKGFQPTSSDIINVAVQVAAGKLADWELLTHCWIRLILRL